jgi:hypothetical protein
VDAERPQGPRPTEGLPPQLREALDAEVRHYLLDAKRRINAMAAHRLRRLTELSQAYVEWVDHTRREIDELIHSLDVGADQVPLDRLRAALGVEAQAAPAATAPAEAVRNDPGNPAQLVATQMALEGATREEIDGYLRGHLGVEDTAEILDAAFGTTSGS